MRNFNNKLLTKKNTYILKKGLRIIPVERNENFTSEQADGLIEIRS